MLRWVLLTCASLSLLDFKVGRLAQRLPGIDLFQQFGKVRPHEAQGISAEKDVHGRVVVSN